MQINKIPMFSTAKSIERNNQRSNFGMTNPFKLQKDVFQKTTNITFEGLKTTQTAEKKAIIKELKSTGKYANEALKNQATSDGWAGKTADWISGAWNSKNRAHLVKEDIQKFEKEVKELDIALKEGKFEQKFKDIFDVEYNQKNIDDYNKKSEDFMLATTTTSISKLMSKKLTSYLRDFDQNKGVLQDKTTLVTKTNVASGTIVQYNSVKNKKEILNEFGNELASLMGGGKILAKSAKTQGVDLKKATDEEKYKVYGKIANYLVETTKITAEKCTNGKSLKTLKEDYETAYEKAYGTKNDIQDRVEKYNRSQRIGAEAVKGVAVAGVVAATVLTAGASAPILTGTGATFGATLLSESMDYATNGIEGDLKENWKNVLKWATLDAATYALTYGLSDIIPSPKTTTKVGKIAVDVAKDTAIDVSLTAGNALLDRGEVTKKELGLAALAAVTFSTLTYSVSAFDFGNLINGGKSKGLSDEAINSAVKSRLLKEQATETVNNIAWESVGYASTQIGVENNPVKQYLEDAKQKLKNDYDENPEKYGELYNMSIKNSEKFNDIVLDVLVKNIRQEHESPNKK